MIIIGNIRTKDIKHAASQLKEAYGGKFSGDFEKNKEAVKELGLIENKRMRNRVVGYLTRMMKRRQ